MTKEKPTDDSMILLSRIPYQYVYDNHGVLHHIAHLMVFGGDGIVHLMDDWNEMCYILRDADPFNSSLSLENLKRGNQNLDYMLDDWKKVSSKPDIPNMPMGCQYVAFDYWYRKAIKVQGDNNELFGRAPAPDVRYYTCVHASKPRLYTFVAIRHSRCRTLHVDWTRVG